MTTEIEPYIHRSGTSTCIELADGEVQIEYRSIWSAMTPAEKRKWRLMQLQQVQAENRKHIKKPRKGKR